MTDSKVRKRVVVCADDFGLTVAASHSIATLAAAGTISATSCVVDGAFTEHYASLLPRGPGFSIGLHFNLTELGASPLNGTLREWLVRSFLRRVDRQAIVRELQRQLDRFETLFKGAPQFVDGHEHVHQFPIVRDALLDVLLARYGTKVAVRTTLPRVWRGLKAQIIASLGGRALERRLIEREVYVNADFAGVYDFTNAIPYAFRMQAWLDSIADNGLIMCHPELSASKKNETLLNSRHQEHEFFASEGWVEQRKLAAVQLVPFTSTTVPSRSILL